MMEYKAIKLSNGLNETDTEVSSSLITEVLNAYAKDKWTLHSTQFLPEVAATQPGYGDLLLIFQRETLEERFLKREENS